MKGATSIIRILVVGMACLPAACTDKDSCFSYSFENGLKGEIRLEHIHDSLSVLRHFIDGTEVSEWELPYPVYRFDCGDLTGDGTPEIAVGVIKPTRYFLPFQTLQGQAHPSIVDGVAVGAPVSGLPYLA